MDAKQPVNWNSTAKIIEILEVNTMSDQLLKKYQTSVNETELGKQHSMIQLTIQIDSMLFQGLENEKKLA